MRVSASAMAVSSSVSSCQMTSQISMFSAFPLTLRLPRLRAEISISSVTTSAVSRVVMIWPPVAIPTIRAATFTASP